MPPPTFLIIDDHALFRSGVAAMLSVAWARSVVLESGTLDQALAEDIATPDIVLLDIQLPGASGLDGIALIARKWPVTRIVIVSGLDLSDAIDEAMRRGAAVFLSKSERPERMIAVLRGLLEEHAEPAGEPRASMPRPLLTPRQREVLDLLGQGLSNKVIGRRLGVSEHTVRGHVQATLTALGASSRSEAVFVARRLGLMP